jgi:translation initiation factor IF-2
MTLAASPPPCAHRCGRGRATARRASAASATPPARSSAPAGRWWWRRVRPLTVALPTPKPGPAGAATARRHPGVTAHTAGVAPVRPRPRPRRTLSGGACRRACHRSPRRPRVATPAVPPAEPRPDGARHGPRVLHGPPRPPALGLGRRPVPADPLPSMATRGPCDPRHAPPPGRPVGAAASRSRPTRGPDGAQRASRPEGPAGVRACAGDPRHGQTRAMARGDDTPGGGHHEGAWSLPLLPCGTIDLGPRQTPPMPFGRPGVRRDRRHDITGAGRCWTRPQWNRVPRGLTSDTPPWSVLQEP